MINMINMVFKYLVCTLAVGVTGHAAVACTIFIACDKHTVLVGNNEDFTPGTPTFLWVRPPQAEKAGYVFWGFEEKYPEGGMNDAGLFFDAAALPEKIAIKKDPEKPDFDGYLVETVLSTCRTVPEAVALVQQYNLTWQEKAQIMIADKSGDYAIIHANYVIRKTDPLFALTNYALMGEQPANFSCWRRETVYQLLDHQQPTVARMKEALSQTTQKSSDNATLYSQICDLKQGVIHLFQQHDFSQHVTLRLADYLTQGKKDLRIASLFPTRIADTLHAYLQTHTIAETITHYHTLKQENGAAFDFAEDELDRLAYRLIDEGRSADALILLQLNLENFPDADRAKASLANGYLLNGNAERADSLYREAATINPNNNYVGLFGQTSGQVNFQIKGMPGAKKIALVGSFTDNGMPEELLTREGDTWSYRKTLPAGRYTYKFLVDDTYWMEDPGNRVHTKVQDWYDSTLIVR